MERRKIYIDILRIAACFLVIANHTNYVYNEAAVHFSQVPLYESVLATTYLALCKCAVTIFLMISGCLLLGRQDDYVTALKRVLRIAIVIVVFSVPYYIVGDFEHSFYDFYLVVGRANVTTAYWYLYLYAGILVMMPILQRMVKGFAQKDYLYFFVFSIFLCTFSFFTEFNMNFKLPLFSAFIGIVVLGYYLDQFVVFPRKWFGVLMISVELVFVFLILVTLYKMKAGADYAATLLEYDNIFYIFVSAGIFFLVKGYCERTFSERMSTVLRRIALDTFGIYLCADMFIHYLKPYFEVYQHMIAVIVLDILVFLGGLAITELLRRIPLVRWLL